MYELELNSSSALGHHHLLNTQKMYKGIALGTIVIDSFICKYESIRIIPIQFSFSTVLWINRVVLLDREPAPPPSLAATGKWDTSLTQSKPVSLIPQKNGCLDGIRANILRASTSL